MKIEVLGVAFDNVTMEQAAEMGGKMLQEDRFHYVVTPNPEFILSAEKDEAFRSILNGADLVIPDGIGVIYSAKILGTPLAERVPGIEFSAKMLEKLNEMGGRLFLLGAKPGVAEKAGENICAQYPNSVLCGSQDGYFKDEEDVILKVAAARPDLLFVCLGAPKQEFWIKKNGPATGAHLLCGLGGSLDVFAGTVERAPKFFCDHGLEWFYRLCKEPKRIGRMMKLPLFLVHVKQEKKRK